MDLWGPWDSPRPRGDAAISLARYCEGDVGAVGAPTGVEPSVGPVPSGLLAVKRRRRIRVSERRLSTDAPTS